MKHPLGGGDEGQWLSCGCCDVRAARPEECDGLQYLQCPCSRAQWLCGETQWQEGWIDLLDGEELWNGIMVQFYQINTETIAHQTSSLCWWLRSFWFVFKTLELLSIFWCLPTLCSFLLSSCPQLHLLLTLSWLVELAIQRVFESEAALTN